MLFHNERSLQPNCVDGQQDRWAVVQIESIDQARSVPGENTRMAKRDVNAKSR